MNIEEYIQSGIIEEYCLGLLSEEDASAFEKLSQTHPEIRDKLIQVQDRLLALSNAYSTKPVRNELDDILSVINEEDKLAKLNTISERLSEFIPISRSSDHIKWKALTDHLNPPPEFDTYSHTLYTGEEGQLFLVWIKEGIPPEVHTDVNESILLLEGHCTGYIEDSPVQLHPGSYFEIPLHKSHSLKVESSHSAKLLVMRKAVA